ncbi:hypothetical protein BGX21_010185 [Mortierella sp. AD011]|nr:hypothetical protein BGX20_000689 [Mortierella sp. AD010]KAF9394892.1 hypothetical protein BGX21_010185 [Mortierella sp. AD011]
MSHLKKLSKIFFENPIINSFIIFIFIACLGIYIGSICAKFITDNDDDTDLMKLILVTVNILGFVLISFGRHINLYKVFRLKIILVVIYLVLLAGLVMNYNIMVIRFRDPDNQTPYNFNVDNLTLAMTLLSDFMFLMVYIFFHSRKILMLTVVLIVLEAVVFGVSFTLGSDDVIDIVNLSTSMITLLFSIVFWSGETILSTPRNRFRHFYEDLDMQNLNPGGEEKRVEDLEVA